MDEPGASEPRESGIPPIEELDRLLLVGLGNPLGQYARTRHNVGFMAIDEWARQAQMSLTQSRFSGRFSDGMWQGKRIFLLKPETYMNLSGQSVAPATRYLNLKPGALVVIHDDIDLKLGRIRVKWAGGSGGHKGIASCDRELGSPDYFRLRIGVGRPASGEVVNHVLSGFSPEEASTLPRILDGVLEALRLLITRGLGAAQNVANGAVF